MRTDTADSATFDRLLRGHRADAQLTQEELAAGAGVGIRTISDLERGVSSPRPATARLLAAALGLSGTVADQFHRVARLQWRALRRAARPAD